MIPEVFAEPADRQVDVFFQPVLNVFPTVSSLEVSVDGASARVFPGANASMGSVTVAGLVNGVSYTFRVRACNEVGCAAFSPSTQPVSPSPS